MREIDRVRMGPIAAALGVVVALGCLAMLVSVPAVRANVTIGTPSTVVGNDTGIDCGSASGDCVLSPSRELRRVASPVNGLVVRWGVRLEPGAPYTRLRTIRFGMFAGSGILHPSPPSGLNEFSEFVPIAVGSGIGAEDPAPGFVQVATGRPVLFAYESLRPASDGSPATGTTEVGAQALIWAEIEPSNAFTFKMGSKAVRGEVMLRVTIPNRGMLAVESIPRLNRSTHKRIVRPTQLPIRFDGGTTTVPLTLTKAARRSLKTTGRANGEVSITYTPTYGTPSTQRAPIKLRRKRRS